MRIDWHAVKLALLGAVAVGLGMAASLPQLEPSRRFLDAVAFALIAVALPSIRRNDPPGGAP